MVLMILVFLQPIGSYSTGGAGAILDGGEGLDPLISAYSIVKTEDKSKVLAVNAGSGSVSVFTVNEDFSLTLTDVESTGSANPVSVATQGGAVYVAHIDGSISAFTLQEDGTLNAIAGNPQASVGGRLSAIQVSKDASYLVAAVLNVGVATETNAVLVYPINSDGSLGASFGATSTGGIDPNSSNLEGYDVTDNPGRNFPTTIGFQIVQENGNTFVIATEAREIQADNEGPAGPFLQAGSVTVYRVDTNSITPVANSTDIIVDENGDGAGQRTTCWIATSPDYRYFWASNALEATISSFDFDSATGTTTLLNETEVISNNNAIGILPPEAFSASDGFIDLSVNSNGDCLYQLYGLSGRIGVYKVSGSALTFMQEIGGLPEKNTQGIVAL